MSHRDPIERFRAAPIQLFAELREPVKSGLLKRLLRRNETSPQPLGELRLEGTSLRLVRGAHGIYGELDTSAPFTIQLGRRDSATGQCELSLRIRPRTAGDDDTDIRLRTLWPADFLAAGVVEAEGLGLFVPPSRFADLWAALSDLVRANGGEPPPGVDPETPPAKLQGLQSVGEPPRCLPCESLDVIVPFPGVIQCLVCDYAGGPGIDEMRERDRRRELMAAPALRRWRDGMLNLYWAAFPPGPRMRQRMPMATRRLQDASYQLPNSFAEIERFRTGLLESETEESAPEAGVLAVVERECSALDENTRARQVARLLKLALRGSENFYTSVKTLDTKAAGTAPEMLKDAREASFALRIARVLDPGWSEFVDSLLVLLDESIRNPERVIGNNDEFPKVQAVIDALEPYG